MISGSFNGVNFVNVFTPSFYECRSQKHKKLLDFTAFFALLGSTGVKAAHKMLVKLTHGLCSIAYLGILSRFVGGKVAEDFIRGRVSPNPVFVVDNFPIPKPDLLFFPVFTVPFLSVVVVAVIVVDLVFVVIILNVTNVRVLTNLFYFS